MKEEPTSHCVTCMCENCEAPRFPRPSCIQIETTYGDKPKVFQICVDCIERIYAQLGEMRKSKHGVMWYTS